MDGSEKWFLQIESSVVYLYLEISSPKIIARMARFLQSRGKNNANSSGPVPASLKIGTFGQEPVTLRSDDEFSDRYFLIIGRGEPAARITIAGKDQKEFAEAIGQALEDLKE